MRVGLSSSTSSIYTLASFFAGVGGIELGFEMTEKFKTVYANEVDENAQITYAKNFKKTLLDKRSIREVEAADVPAVDVITGGFPCQAFSVAGYRRGFEDDRGDLFFDLLRIIKNKNPRVIFIENVKNMVGHDHGNTFKVIREALVLNGYYISWKVLNSSDYGNIPQNRERIYIIGFKNKLDYDNFEFPEQIELKIRLDDVIDFESELDDESLYYRDGKQPFYNQLEDIIISKETIYQWRRQYVRENKSGVVPTLTANMGTGGHNVPLIYTDHGIRKLTPRETFNVQGYPKNYILPELAKSHLYKQAGNSVTVPVIKRIATNIADALEKNEEPLNEMSLPQNGEKYAIIYTEIHGRYAGTSVVEKYIHSIDELDGFKRKYTSTLRPFITAEQYLNIVAKGLSSEFYMVIDV